MMDIRAAIQMAQEMLEDSVKQIKTNVEENSKEGIDSKIVVEAITAVGTLVGGIATEFMSKLPKPSEAFSSTSSNVGEEARRVVNTELDKIIGRMGLVQEDELAALRKRVVDLEAQLGASAKPGA
jgi:hypothetical protein